MAYFIVTQNWCICIYINIILLKLIINFHSFALLYLSCLSCSQCIFTIQFTSRKSHVCLFVFHSASATYLRTSKNCLVQTDSSCSCCLREYYKCGENYLIKDHVTLVAWWVCKKNVVGGRFSCCMGFLSDDADWSSSCHSFVMPAGSSTGFWCTSNADGWWANMFMAKDFRISQTCNSSSVYWWVFFSGQLSSHQWLKCLCWFFSEAL